MRWQPAIAALCALALLSCSRVSSADARRLVETYIDAVSEAYRRCDVNLIDSIVGPNTSEGKKLTGLIGIRLDTGVTLDAHLLTLDVTGVEQDKNELKVRTKERWRYRDLKIGTGEQVGEESVDNYEMLYTFRKFGKAWMVDKTQFAAPPQVGRKATPWQADRRLLHGTVTNPDQKGKEKP
jgi:hypothetical protein